MLLLPDSRNIVTVALCAAFLGILDYQTNDNEDKSWSGPNITPTTLSPDRIRFCINPGLKTFNCRYILSPPTHIHSFHMEVQTSILWFTDIDGSDKDWCLWVCVWVAPMVILKRSSRRRRLRCMRYVYMFRYMVRVSAFSEGGMFLRYWFSTI